MKLGRRLRRYLRQSWVVDPWASPADYAVSPIGCVIAGAFVAGAVLGGALVFARFAG